MEIKANDEIIANLIPFVLNAKIANIKITIGKGIKLKRVSSPFNTESIGAESFLKSGR